MAKNKTIATVLGLIIPGIGQAYLGLYKRFIVLIIVDIILSSLISVVGDIATYILLLLMLYSAYDASKCTDAINNNQPIPKLLGIDLQ
ncbi:MAG: hypothetical protein SOZ23_05175 [Methanosphaera sp.]|uniref:hypothetical protein n=1 Tax=Methanosphaera sp. TaxID=2666342 RepID=UPI0025F1831B|nr:hypothetical protein [Methanosphaera sp.]MCI5867554.1 hypothetical protein [Methanosphaera sp.]MDD6534021.1 hypothetical protein [Methanosphaera sp.]MDY3956169.1 hypothetical protein [Methanosphaera sp.]